MCFAVHSKPVTVRMLENISHHRCRSGGGKNKRPRKHVISDLSLYTQAARGREAFARKRPAQCSSRHKNTMGNLRNLLKGGMLFLLRVRKSAGLTPRRRRQRIKREYARRNVPRRLAHCFGCSLCVFFRDIFLF